jgi:uncharacterized membrane protein YhhN
MWILILSVVIVIAAALTISAERHGSKHLLYVCKPLVIVFIVLLTLIPKYPVAPIYRYLIVAGLVCSLVGDVFLMLPQDRFIHGLVSFLVAHLFYIAAFTSGDGLRVPSLWAGVPLFVYGGLMLWWLWPHLGKLRAPVIIYMLVILIMAWAAVGRYLGVGPAGSLLAALGAVLFMASDSILAVDRFRGGFRSAQSLILITYFIAQYLIALST